MKTLNGVNYEEKKWSSGQVVRNNKGEVVEVFAGLFLNKGLGLGHYFSLSNEIIVLCPVLKAIERAREEKVPFKFIDGLGY